MTAGLFIVINEDMIEKRPIVHNSPDLSKMKEVIIDHRTRIYIAPDADAVEARSRYLANLKNRKP